jgi:hypothetical protein
MACFFSLSDMPPMSLGAGVDGDFAGFGDIVEVVGGINGGGDTVERIEVEEAGGGDVRQMGAEITEAEEPGAVRV